MILSSLTVDEEMVVILLSAITVIHFSVLLSYFHIKKVLRKELDREPSFSEVILALFLVVVTASSISRAISKRK